MVTSEEVGHRSSPKKHLKRPSDQGANAAEPVMVGDSWDVDVVGTTRASILSVWFNRRGTEGPTDGTVSELRPMVPTGSACRVIFGC